jgi:hypothetical protein
MVNPFEEVNRGAERIEPSANKPVRLKIATGRSTA